MRGSYSEETAARNSCVMGPLLIFMTAIHFTIRENFGVVINIKRFWYTEGSCFSKVVLCNLIFLVALKC